MTLKRTPGKITHIEEHLIPHSVVSRIQDFNNSPYMPGATLRVCGQFPDPIGF